MVAQRSTRTSGYEVSNSGDVPAISASQLFRQEKKSLSDRGYSPTSLSGSEVNNSGVVPTIMASPMLIRARIGSPTWSRWHDSISKTTKLQSTAFFSLSRSPLSRLRHFFTVSMAEGKLDLPDNLLSSRLSDQSWTSKGGDAMSELSGCIEKLSATGVMN